MFALISPGKAFRLYALFEIFGWLDVELVE
jgi:hypothetical protein